MVTVSDDKNLLDFETIHRYLSEESYWAKGVPREVMARAIEHSICFGAYDDGKQVGFARVITDRATFAYVADVFVLESHRGREAAKAIMVSSSSWRGFVRSLRTSAAARARRGRGSPPARRSRSA